MQVPLTLRDGIRTLQKLAIEHGGHFPMQDARGEAPSFTFFKGDREDGTRDCIIMGGEAAFSETSRELEVMPVGGLGTLLDISEALTDAESSLARLQHATDEDVPPNYRNWVAFLVGAIAKDLEKASLMIDDLVDHTRVVRSRAEMDGKNEAPTAATVEASRAYAAGH